MKDHFFYVWSLQCYGDQAISWQLKIHVCKHVLAILTTYMETRLYFYGDAFTSIMKQPYNTFTTILRLITNKITTILRTRLGFLQQPLSSMATSHVVVRLLQTCEFAVDLLLLQTAFPLMRFTCRRRKSRHRRSEKKRYHQSFAPDQCSCRNWFSLIRWFQVMGVPRNGGQCLSVIYLSIVPLIIENFTKYLKTHPSE